MKKIIAVMAVLLGIGSVSALEVQAQTRAKTFAQTCPRIILVGGPSSTIYKNSAPLRRGGPGTPIIGFRREPTLIYNARNFAGGTHTVYDGNGTSLGRCPVTSAKGHAGRARCSFQTSALRRAAIRNTRKPEVFFKINGNTCVRVPDAGRCYGSVKGLCNQLIG